MQLVRCAGQRDKADSSGGQDGVFLTDLPQQLVKNGKYAKGIPIINGGTSKLRAHHPCSETPPQTAMTRARSLRSLSATSRETDGGLSSIAGTDPNWTEPRIRPSPTCRPITLPACPWTRSSNCPPSTPPTRPKARLSTRVPPMHLHHSSNVSLRSRATLVRHKITN